MIDTRAKLRAAIQDELTRLDGGLGETVNIGGQDVDSAVDRAIARCEIRIQRTIRVRQMETSTSIATVGGTAIYALPGDFLSAQFAYLDTDPVFSLAQDSLANLFAEFADQATAQPQKFAVVGSNIHLRPVPDGVYTLKLFYYQSITPLSDSVSTNWLLEDAPDLYLYGSCLELSPYLGDDERIQVWKGAFDEGVRLLTEDNDTAKWSGVLVQAALPVQVVV